MYSALVSNADYSASHNHHQGFCPDYVNNDENPVLDSFSQLKSEGPIS